MANNNLQVSAGADNQQVDPIRPPSGCSAHTNEPEAKRLHLLKQSEDTDGPTPTPLINIPSESSHSLDAKLADLELDDVALECLLNEQRDCQSRSSKSSNEEAKRDMTPLN